MATTRILRLAMIVVTVAFVMSLTTASAQPPQGMQGMRMSVDDRVKMLNDSLSLTKVQADSVRKIYVQADSDRAKLFEKSGGDRSAMREAMQAMRDGIDKKIEALLTDEQKPKYARIKSQRRGMGGPPPGQRRQEN